MHPSTQSLAETVYVCVHVYVHLYVHSQDYTPDLAGCQVCPSFTTCLWSASKQV